MTNFLKDKRFWIIAAIVVVIIIVVVLVARYKKRKAIEKIAEASVIAEQTVSKTTPSKTTTTSKTGTAVTQTNTSTVSAETVALIRSLAEGMYKDMKGVNIKHDIEVYKKYLNSSDVIFIATYNTFNKYYENENNGTLREWLNDEINVFSPEFGQVRSAIFTRMNKFNLY